MTFRRRWLSILLASFGIFGLSVFAFTALAVWFGATDQGEKLEETQAIVMDNAASTSDSPVVAVRQADVRGKQIDAADRSGQAVTHPTNIGSPPESERGETDSLSEAIQLDEVATPVQEEAFIDVDDLSTMVLRGTASRLPAPTVISQALPDSPSPLDNEPQTDTAQTTEIAEIDALLAPDSEPQINSLPLSAFLIMPDDVLTHARSIIARGEMLGRNPRAYSKVGDSTIENPNFMTRFDDGAYDLGDFSYLKSVIEYYSGSHSRQGMAVKRGMHSWSVNDPMWADNRLCYPNETPLTCEIRLHNPSIVFIRLGSNDSGTPSGFEKNLRQVVDLAIERGVLPILGTKADRFEGSDINNQIIRRVAAEARVPLWDFDRVARTLPDSGLKPDGVHLTVYYAHDYTSPTAYQRGHGLHNLSALLVLDAVWRDLILSGE